MAFISSDYENLREVEKFSKEECVQKGIDTLPVLIYPDQQWSLKDIKKAIETAVLAARETTLR